MENYISVLQCSALFNGISPDETDTILQCLSAVSHVYRKGTFIFHFGDRISSMALLLEGCVHIQREDVWGNQSILTQISPGDIFGEVYACLGEEALQTNAAAIRDSTVLMLDIKRLLTVCPSSCIFHMRLIHNLVTAISRKNKLLNEKLMHTSQRTIRGKLLSYLSLEAQKQKSPDFYIPFNRQQLADYLSADRSALSSELSKLRAEQLLYYHKNHFTLHLQNDNPF